MSKYFLIQVNKLFKAQKYFSFALSTISAKSSSFLREPFHKIFSCVKCPFKLSEHVFELTSPTIIPLIVSAGPHIGLESSSESVSSCCASSASLIGFSSTFSKLCVSFCGRLTAAAEASLALFKLSDLRGGIGGASSNKLLTTMLVVFAVTLLFDIGSISVTLLLGVAVVVNEDVLDDDELMEDDEDNADGVECVALTTIVFGAFPFKTFTLTTFTTVVLFNDGALEATDVDVSARISFCCSAVLLITLDEVVDVVGMIGAFLVSLGEV